MVSKVTKKIDLTEIDEFKKLNNEGEALAKRQVGNFLKETILDYVGEGRSPVDGVNYVKSLSPEYKKYKSTRSSVSFANMELTGAMLDSLKFKTTDQGIEIGIFEKSQVPKADGHNNHSGDSKLPNRRFIPKENEDFRGPIEDKVKKIVQKIYNDPDYRKEDKKSNDKASSDFFKKAVATLVSRKKNG